MTTAISVPALRQSIVETMSCPHSYGLVQIEGMKPPNTQASTRGTEIHAVLAKYAEHCARHRCPADFAYLDSLLYNVGDESAQILETCRENIAIDWQNFFGAEISMGLDEEFRPTWSYDHSGNCVPMAGVWAMEGSGQEPAYCGVADALYLYPGGRAALIEDAKSHPRPFPADTTQARLYALMVMMHLPEVQEVTFKLRFVRYTNITTSQTFYRADVPKLMDDIRRVRGRQIEYHATYEFEGIPGLPALAGSVCVYCPAAAQPKLCPISELNPLLNMSPQDRLQFRLWMDAANRVNNEAMKSYVEGSGENICATDANGKAFVFGPAPKEKMTFPLFKLREGETLPQMMADIMQNPERILDHMPIVAALVDHAISDPADLAPKRKGLEPWQLKLRIGSTELSSPLKAKSREVLHNAIKDVANVEGKVELRITRDAEVDDGTGEEHRDYGAEKEW